MGLSIGHIVLFAIIILVIFGTAKLKNFGKDVGGAVKDFKDAVQDDKKDKNSQYFHLKVSKIISYIIRWEPSSLRF
mgnify:CR=1 FL=1